MCSVHSSTLLLQGVVSELQVCGTSSLLWCFWANEADIPHFHWVVWSVLSGVTFYQGPLKSHMSRILDWLTDWHVIRLGVSLTEYDVYFNQLILLNHNWIKRPLGSGSCLRSSMAYSYFKLTSSDWLKWVTVRDTVLLTTVVINFSPQFNTETSVWELSSICQRRHQSIDITIFSFNWI